MDENKKEKEEQSRVKGYGGYSSRQEYEDGKKRRVTSILQIAVLVVVLIFLILGAARLLDWYRADDTVTPGGGDGAIKVPSQSDLSEAEKDATVMLREIDPSLVTLEVTLEDGSVRYGSGFLVSQDGYAVCSSRLFENASPEKEILGYTAEGMNYTVLLEGEIRELGFSLVRLEGNWGCTPVTVGNFAFLERGETLFAAASSHLKEFPGTALSGVVASTGYSVKVEVEGSSHSVPVAFLDVTPNESLYGAPAVDLTGSVYGLCTHAVKSPYGNLTAVVSIHSIYTLINDMYSE